MDKFKKIHLDNRNLTGKQITKLIEMHETNKSRFNKLQNYYENNNEIIRRSMTGDKPNNKIAHSFAKYITDMSTSYFMGKGVRYFIDDEKEEFQELFKSVLDTDYEKDNIYELAKESSIKGISYELLYIDENSNLKSKQLNSEEVIPIFSNRVDEFLTGAIRVYSIHDFEMDKVIYYAEYYNDEEIITYKKEDSNYIEINREYHRLGDVPFILYLNNKEIKGDFENVISLIDAYDKAQSDTANDFEYFTDAYLVLVGAGEGFTSDDEDSEDVKKVKSLKQERILLLQEKGGAEWLIKNINDTAVENYKNRIFKDTFFLSFVPPLTDESFHGNLSGVAISYKLIGLESLATTKENKFKASIKKKLKIITEFINLKYNKSFNADDIKIKFDRNTVKNLSEIIDNIVKLEDTLSLETRLRQLPIVEDVSKELDKIKAELQEKEGLFKEDEDNYFEGNV